MRDEVLDADVKARVPKTHKRRLRELAQSRHLKTSDILREAIREKIERERLNGKELQAA